MKRDVEGIRRAAIAGIVGPLTFLGTGFVMAAFRFEVIQAQGWASWPSSMAVGWPVGLPQIFAFLFLAVCYSIFAPLAVRPMISSAAAWLGFLIIAIGDVLLAFPTDGPNRSTSWHGLLHATGVIVATLGTLIAVIGVTRATWSDPRWRVWRVVGAPMTAAGIVIGILGGLEIGWAKVAYVLGITLPVPLLAVLLRSAAGQATPIQERMEP